MECDVYDISRFAARCIHILKWPDAIRGVHSHIELIRLTKSLDVLGACPLEICARLGDHIFKSAFFILFRWSRDIGGSGCICGRSSTSRTATLTTLGNKLHEVFFVSRHVIGKTLPDLVGMGGVTIELV